MRNLDGHNMVLGQDFLKFAQSIPMVDQYIPLITTGGQTMVVLMNRRSCLGYRTRISLMALYPKDPNVKHDYVEQRGLGCMTQTTKERKIVDFVTRARRKYEGGKEVSHILRHLRDASSTEGLHHGVVDEGISSTSSKTVVGEYYADIDPTGIVGFCRYAIGIYDFHLTK